MRIRRFIILTLVFLLLLCSSAFAAIITEAQKTLAKEGTQAFWDLVTPSYGTSIYKEVGYADLKISSPDSPVFPQLVSDDIQPQVEYTVRMQEMGGVGFTIEQVTAFYSLPWNTISMRDITGNILENGPIYIPPYGSFSYGSGGPRGGNFQYEIIVVAGTDDNGHEQEFYGIVERLNVYTDAPSENGVSENADYDTENLRYNADFAEEVTDDVWWVPVASLGESRYTNRDIAAMVADLPEEKQADISTLYEALQLFQISSFYNGDDNVRIVENDIDWEHHKPGYDAVRTNNGCCATDSNWLNYILRDDYDEVGFIAYSELNGSGHIFNYIKQEDDYYFIDLTHYRTDFLDSSAPETGNLTDYRNSDFIAGNLHKAASPEAYIRYCVDSYNNPPARFFLYRADDCMPVTGKMIDGQMTIIYPNTVDIAVYPGAQAEQLSYVFVDPPQRAHDWAAIPSHVFEADASLLKVSDETPDRLSAYQVGDRLPLEDYGDLGFAEIDGLDYSYCNSDSSFFIIEGLINLIGGNYYSYHDNAFSVSQHSTQTASMESLCLGDLIIDVLHSVDSVEMIRCVQEGSELIVTEVLPGVHSIYEPLYLLRDENADWQPSDKIWYLIHYEMDGEVQREFGRFFCNVAP